MRIILGSQSPRRRELLERMGLEFTVLTAEIDETKFETEDPEASVRRICEAKACAVAERMQNEAAGNGQQAAGDGGYGLPRQCAHWLAMTESEADPAAGNAADVTCHLSPVTCHLILTADTIVVLDGRILGKPHGEDEARAMLRALSGREHAVYTAFTLLPVQATGNREQATGDGGTDCHDQSADWSRNDNLDTFTHCEKTFVKFRALSAEEIDAYVATGEPMDKAGAYGIQGLGAMLVEGIRGDYFTVMGLPVCQLSQALKRFGIDPMLKQEDQQ